MPAIKVSTVPCRGNLNSDACHQKEKADHASLPYHRQERICLVLAPLSNRIGYFMSEDNFFSPAFPEGLWVMGELTPAPTCSIQRNTGSGRSVARSCPEVRETCQLHAINILHFSQLNNSPALQTKQEALKLLCNTECQALWSKQRTCYNKSVERFFNFVSLLKLLDCRLKA